MIAEIITVGTEILLGDILNTNAQYLSKRLAELGMSMYYQTVVGDNPARIELAVTTALERSDIIITTGGLGPTDDDLTKEVIAGCCNLPLECDQESYQTIQTYFQRSNRVMTENNKKQAFFPAGSSILKNGMGTAPGCIIEKEAKKIIVLPGPPSEMQFMFEEEVVPYLVQFQDGVIVSRVLRMAGIGESAMEDLVKDIIDLQQNPTIAPYAGNQECQLRITAHASTREHAEALITPVEQKLRERLGLYIYGVDQSTLENEVAALLVAKQLSIGIAESCTGGLISAQLVNYPGISAVLKESVVVYSNEAKMNRLGVKEETLEAHGAVSAETAMEMASGLAATAGTDVALSITGIAGPGGGSETKPVGLIYMGLYLKGKISSKKIMLQGERNRIRMRATVSALDWLRRELLHV